jgi:molybdate transport system substrate-binding protein
MISRFVPGAIVAVVLSVLVPSFVSADENQAIRLLVSNGMKAAMEELKPGCEQAVGAPLEIQFSSTAALKKRIEAGEVFDGTLISAEGIADLIKQGKLVGASRVDLGRSALGIGIRAGAPKPDIRTTVALKQALLNAPSITYPRDGATRGFIEKMFERMGIAGQLKPKIILAPSSGAATGSVAAGKAAFVITLFSEIVPVRGVEILGALPGEYQNYVNFTIAANTSSKNAKAISKLAAFLKGQQTASVLKAKGLELH